MAFQVSSKIERRPIVWRRRILATSKPYLRCTFSIKVAQWGKIFRLARHRKYAERSKAGALSLVVSLPRQTLAIEVSPRLPVTALPGVLRATRDNI